MLTRVSHVVLMKLEFKSAHVFMLGGRQLTIGGYINTVEMRQARSVKVVGVKHVVLLDASMGRR